MKTEEEQQQIENTEVVEEQENDIKPVVEHSVKVCQTHFYSIKASIPVKCFLPFSCTLSLSY